MAGGVDLILKDIQDPYVRENFFRLSNFVNQSIFFDGDFKFFEVDIKAADINFKIKHALTFVPTDIFFLAVTGDHNFYFKYQDFDRNFIYVSASGPCRIRFLAGRLSENARSVIKEKYPLVAPTGGGGGGGGTITSITSLSSAIVVTNPTGPNVQLSFNSAALVIPSAPKLEVTVIAGEAISALQAVYYNYSDDRVYKGNKGVYATSLVLGVARTAAASAGASLIVVTNGNIVDASFAFTANELIFLQTGGTISNVVPTTGHRVVVGKALTSNTLFVNTQEPIILV